MALVLPSLPAEWPSDKDHIAHCGVTGILEDSFCVCVCVYVMCAFGVMGECE